MIALLLRDLRLATRAGGGFGLSLAFFLIVTVLVPFGDGPEGGTLSRIAPGILWVGALLACLLSLDTTSVALFAAAMRAHLGQGGAALMATHIDLGLNEARTLDLTPYRAKQPEPGQGTGFDEAFA